MYVKNGLYKKVIDILIYYNNPILAVDISIYSLLVTLIVCFFCCRLANPRVENINVSIY